MLNPVRFPLLSHPHPFRPGQKFKGRYNIVPYDIFRIQEGPDVQLRPRARVNKAGKRGLGDLTLQRGGVVAPAIGEKYKRPNGCPVRSMGPNLQDIVRKLARTDLLIYRLPKGERLPPELVLLHEHTDQLSIQVTRKMRLEELNQRLTDLFNARAERLFIDQFLQRYPFEEDIQTYIR